MLGLRLTVIQQCDDSCENWVESQTYVLKSGLCHVLSLSSKARVKEEQNVMRGGV